MSFKVLVRAAATIGMVFALVVDVPVGAIAVGGVGGRPANPDPNNPRTQSIFVLTLDKGESGKDTALVVNNSEQTQTIRLYAVDGLTTNTGSFTCRQEADARVGLGKWTTISKSEVTLASGDNTEVPFTVKMPANVDVGEHNGCIVFQTKDDNSTADNEDGGSVQIKTRQALRLAVTVPGDLKRDVTIENFDVTTVEGQQAYVLDINNVGNVSADVDVSVKVKSVFGGEIYSNGGGYPVLSDTSLSLTYTQEETPMFGGFYSVEATVSYDSEIGTLGVETGSTVTKSSGEKVVFIAPSATGALILLVLMLAVIAAVTWYVRRYLRHKKVVNKGDTHTVKKGDTIQSVADEYGMSWKHLAATNKIKAPYTLKEGQTLHVSATKRQKQE